MIFLLVNNEDILNVLGKNIKKVRKEKGYTQDYVAEQINVSTDLLRSIENGRNIGSITTLLNICNFLQVSPNTLFAKLLNFKEDTLDSSLLNLTHQLSKEDKNILKEIIIHIDKFLIVSIFCIICQFVFGFTQTFRYTCVLPLVYYSYIFLDFLSFF